MSSKFAKAPTVAAPAADKATSGAVQASIMKSFQVQPLIQKLSGGIFYVALGSFLLFIFLIILHYTSSTPVFSFGIDDSGFVELPTPDKELTFVGKATSNTKLPFPNPAPFEYTLMCNVFIKGDFNLTNAPLVFLYRASSAVSVPESATWSALPGLFSNNSNFVLWVDPQKNDIHAMFFCDDGEPITMDKPIENVPIGQDFRLTLVVSCQRVECYLNGELVKTVVLSKRLKTTSDPFFGPPAISSPSLSISTISYWEQVLSSRVIRIKGSI